jgi:cbb3-type cytochrome oxidase maturation protein
MNVVYILLPVALLIAVGYLVVFIISVRKGQYDDTTTPAVRMLFDDDSKKNGEADEDEPDR